MRAIPQKIQILRFIGEQGIVCLDDIARHISFQGKSETLRRLLYKFGVKQVQYPGVKHGVWFIAKPELYDLINCHFPDLPALQLSNIPAPQFLHYLEINRIRVTLENSPKITVDEWWSENHIRALEQSHFLDTDDSNVPDAIFWRKRQDGNRKMFFLEYERTLKNRERYEGIFCSYAKREGVDKRNVIYICQTLYIWKVLINIEARLVKAGKLSGTGSFFQFVTLEGFYRAYGIDQSNQEEDHEDIQAVVENARV